MLRRLPILLPQTARPRHVLYSQKHYVRPQSTSSLASSKPLGFSDPNFDWDLYVRARPRYPESLWNTILSYHKFHHDSYRKALEVGSSYGMGTKDFLSKHFQHTWATDPVPHNLEAGKHLLKDLVDAGKVTTLLSGAEDEVLPKGSADLILALQCLHWGNSSKFIPAFASQLKPGGTLAAVYYTNVSIVGNSRANEAWVRAMSKATSIWNAKPGSEGLTQAWDGLNTVLPLSVEHFAAGVRRIRLNANVLDPVQHRTSEVPFKLHLEHGNGAGKSHANDHNVRENGVSDDWTKEVDRSWLRETISSFQVSPAEVEEELSEVDAVVGKDRFKVRWVVDIVLATRK